MRSFLCLCSFLFITACGFSPLYYTKEDNPTTQKTQEVAIEPIGEYNGFLLHDALERALNPNQVNKEKKYILTVSLYAPSFTDQSIQGNAFSSRKKVSLRASYKLKDMQTKEVLLSDSTTALGAYNILAQPYATQISQKKQKEDLIKIIAQNISLRVIAYFKKTGDNR